MQRLWFNKNIQIGYCATFYYHWYSKNINCVKDITNINGSLLSLNELKTKFKLPVLNYLEFYSLINSIPRQWKNILCKASSNKSALTHDEYTMYVNINDKKWDIHYTYNKDLYWALVNKKAKPAVPAESKWFNLQPENIKTCYQISFKNIRHTKIHKMQFKIIHGFYACNLKRYQWKIKLSNCCSYCKDVDYIEHHFYHCNKIKYFWNSMLNWWF